MPRAESGAVLVLVAAAGGAAMAALKRPDSYAGAGHASIILRPKQPSRISAIAVTVLASHALQSSGHTSLASMLQQFAPVAGVTIALIAFVGTTLQYLRDRKRERGLRVEEGIAESTNKLTAFPGTSDAGIGSVVAALRSLREFVARSADPAGIETEVAEILATVAREDLDYRDPRHARFDMLCLQHWKGYRSYQTENDKENLYVLDQYIGALTELDDRTGLVKSVGFSEAGMENIPPRATDSDIALLARLTEGYGLRLALLSLPAAAQNAEQRFFKASGGNKNLHEKMLSAKIRGVSLYASTG
jgi:hypothetical protein